MSTITNNKRVEPLSVVRPLKCIILAWLWSTPAFAYPEALLARDFLKLSQTEKENFASAAYWGVIGGVTYGDDRNNLGWLLGCTEHWSADQLAAALTNWFMAKPTRFGNAAGTRMFHALVVACPNSPKALKSEVASMLD